MMNTLLVLIDIVQLGKEAYCTFRNMQFKYTLDRYNPDKHKY